MDLDVQKYRIIIIFCPLSLMFITHYNHPFKSKNVLSKHFRCRKKFVRGSEEKRIKWHHNSTPVSQFMPLFFFSQISQILTGDMSKMLLVKLLAKYPNLVKSKDNK